MTISQKSSTFFFLLKLFSVEPTSKLLRYCLVLGPLEPPSETIHNINIFLRFIVTFLFRTCVSLFAPHTTVSEHGEYFIEFFSSIRDTCRRYSRFWPQVRVFLWAEKGGEKRGNLGDEKLCNRF